MKIMKNIREHSGKFKKFSITVQRFFHGIVCNVGDTYTIKENPTNSLSYRKRILIVSQQKKNCKITMST